VGAVIAKFAGIGKPRMDLFVTTSNLQYPETAGSLLEPAGHPKVITVGATCWSDDKLASYSSRGPTIAGAKKPDVAAPTAVTTSVYGAGSANCSTGFSGTSSAAPHAAGMAALILQGSPSLPPSKVADRLEANVVDLGGSGKDNKFGSGRVEAHGLCDGQVASIVGTDSAETLSGTSKRDVIAGYGGGDVIKGRDGNDLICAGKGFDTVYGGKGNDEMRGQDGSDVLLGGPDSDKYYGGDGDNTASFANAAAPVVVDLSAGTATGEGTDTLTAILNVFGSPFDDHIQGSGAANSIKGMGGRDHILGGAGADELIGGPGGDELMGEDGADVLAGKKGADTLRGGKGSDLLMGGPHPDDIRGGNGDDTVSYEDAPGIVTVRLDKRKAFGAWALDQLLAIENVIGSRFADTLVGDDLGNIIRGRAGDDHLRGGPGDDTIHGQGGFDEAHGGGGLDLCLTVEIVSGCE
jgi:Ca2+-binding RTX toxin-like protein